MEVSSCFGNELGKWPKTKVCHIFQEDISMIHMEKLPFKVYLDQTLSQDCEKCLSPKNVW